MMVRTFVSIPVGDIPSLAEVSKEARSLGNVKASPAGQVHMTLKFIGDVDERKVPKVVDAVRRACEGVHPFDMELKGVGCFPNIKRPSVIWVGAGPRDTLSDLAGRIGRELSASGIGFDDKPFKSHITVGRCRGPVDVAPLLEKYDGAVFCTIRCDRVLVMKSVLSPSGAKHSVISDVFLS